MRVHKGGQLLLQLFYAFAVFKMHSVLAVLSRVKH